MPLSEAWSLGGEEPNRVGVRGGVRVTVRVRVRVVTWYTGFWRCSVRVSVFEKES